MEITLKTLLTRPGQFFDNFYKLPPKWIVAYLGYFLFFFPQILVTLTYGEFELSIVAIYLIAFFGSLLGVPLARFSYGFIWMYLGSRIFGGRPYRSEIGDAVGYAFLFPGIFGLVIVPFAAITALAGVESSLGIALLCVNIPVILLASLGAVVYSAFAVKHLNGFGWLKTLGVLAWYPALGLVLGGITFLLISVTAG